MGGDFDARFDEQAVVRLMYGTLELYLRESGHRASFAVDELATHYSPAFSDLTWTDIVTLSGPRLAIRPVSVEANGRALGVAYEASWETARREQREDFLAHVEGKSLRQVLDEAAEWENGIRSVVAATTYRVSAKVDNESVTYRAAALWIAGEEGRVSLALQDHVAELADQALVETRRPTSRLEMLNRFRDALDLKREHRSRSASAYSVTTECRAEPTTHGFNQQAGPDSQGHASGHHEASARFNYVCECDSTCRSTCTPNVSNQFCYEFGNLTGFAGVHKTRVSEKIVPGSIPDAVFTGANCGSGFACYVQFCPSGVCSGFSISPSVQPMNVGVGVTFNASSSWVWDGQIDFPFQCDGCAWGEAGDQRPVEEHKDTAENTGGGAGGGGTFCAWDCDPVAGSDGIFYEECTLHCMG